jgi:hypothetical protein
MSKQDLSRFQRDQFKKEAKEMFSKMHIDNNKVIKYKEDEPCIKVEDIKKFEDVDKAYIKGIPYIPITDPAKSVLKGDRQKMQSMGFTKIGNKCEIGKTFFCDDGAKDEASDNGYV